ncbi:MAG TPA: hypothetical protein VNS63_20755 [Blastocatellia bacterium]|nr:hypothetical protein [Blastocatellia bacterium]
MNRRSKVLAKMQIRRTNGSRTAIRAGRRQLGLADAWIVIGNLPLDRCVVRIATAAALFHAAGHPANIRRLSSKSDRRRDGGNQQEHRGTKGSEPC